jgi:hypothetical protein
MKPYCHMGDMCIGCSPQLIEGICPDSRAGMIVAELVDSLKFVIRGVPDTWEGVQKARAAIAKATGENA